MSFVSVVPEALTIAADESWGIGARIVASGVSADAVTTTVVAPGADDVSARVAARLRAQAVSYREVSGRGAVIFDDFLASLLDSAAAYLTTEADNATRAG
ncbi:PE family protein [Mycobacterium decipiens]|uniref:PE domain-containing protein n=1 Tax=Mycobacterium decipiens TaxID=1430326 RepID=A0A1X2LTH5_9MYCO|nr:PE family protein [Mycobacterium decipiens]OSC39518.1 hypothetical protein B8W66_16705 [Mycobacterium decipiens]